MTVVGLIVLVVALAVVWRLVRLVIRVALLAALVAVGVWYVHQHTQSSPAPPRPALAGQVIKVVDGDTLDVRVHGRSERVRLLGIDAPERSSTRSGRPDCGGRAATAAMRALVAPGTTVTLSTDRRSGAVGDRYGRLLAYVNAGGTDLGEAQLQAGMADVYRYQDRRFSRLAGYLRAERHARRADRGVWRICGGRFHTPAR